MENIQAAQLFQGVNECGLLDFRLSLESGHKVVRALQTCPAPNYNDILEPTREILQKMNYFCNGPCQKGNPCRGGGRCRPRCDWRSEQDYYCECPEGRWGRDCENGKNRHTSIQLQSIAVECVNNSQMSDAIPTRSRRLQWFRSLGAWRGTRSAPSSCRATGTT